VTPLQAARDAAVGKKHPAFGGVAHQTTWRAGCVAPLARWPDIALRDAPIRRDDPRHQMTAYDRKVL
jgi:hypothetical protein